MLRQVHRAEDPLVASGGLMRMAEGGLLQERLAVEEQGRPPLLHEPKSVVAAAPRHAATHAMRGGLH